RAHARQFLRICAHAGHRRPDRVHHDPRRRAGDRGACGPHPADRVYPHGRAGEGHCVAADPSVAPETAGQGRMTAQASLLPDGRRLHLNEGPIDTIIEAWGEPREVRAAYDQATAAFRDVLPTLVKDLTVLRWPLSETAPDLRGPVARRMLAACWAFRNSFITPMAAVAGAVADHLLVAMLAGRRLSRAYVNDGGDIAFHLAPKERLTCGVVGNMLAPTVDGKIELT